MLKSLTDVGEMRIYGSNRISKATKLAHFSYFRERFELSVRDIPMALDEDVR